MAGVTLTQTEVCLLKSEIVRLREAIPRASQRVNLASDIRRPHAVATLARLRHELAKCALWLAQAS